MPVKETSSFATGNAGGVQSARTEVYEASSGTWTELGAMSTSRWGCSIAELPDGNVLVAGGNDASEAPLATAEICNPHVPPGGLGGVRPRGDAGSDAGSLDRAADGAPE